MRSSTVFLVLLTFIACSKKDSPKTPVAATLSFPAKNSECTTGQNVNGTNTSVVEFKWNRSDHSEMYELRATNLNTNTVQTATSAGTSAKLTLEMGSPYSWFVVSKNSRTNETAKSEVWLFYNAGFATTYAPFPAAVIAPKFGSTITKDINNEVKLIWEGADIDNDLAGYEVYFSTTTPPITKIASLGPGNPEIKVSVNPKTTYYWHITTVDLEGNSSTNAISTFKVR